MAYADFEFAGIPQIMTAYNDRGVDGWALFSAKRLIVSGIGSDDLERFLKQMALSGSPAVYTLKVYEDATVENKVKSNTPDDGSFNFKLFSIGSSGFGGLGQMGGMTEQRIIDMIDERLPKPEAEDESFVSSICKAFIGMLNEPAKLNDFLSAINGIGGVGARPPAYYPNAVGTITRAAPREQTKMTGYPDADLTSADSLQRIGDAIEQIGKIDPKIVSHLEILAALAKDNPAKFKMLIGLLESGV